MENQKELFEGTKITMGGKEWIVPSLSLKQARTMRPQLELLSEKNPDGGFSPQQMDVVLELVHAAMSRNYPEVTKNEVEDMVDFRSLLDVMVAITGLQSKPAQA